jgi:hypothetical protein
MSQSMRGNAAYRATLSSRVLARNISGSSFDLGTATLSVAVMKRRIP